MNIVVVGAGAIGSFFGAMLSKNNNVFLVGRKKHVDTINKNGLRVDGKTKMNARVEAFTSVNDVYIVPDVVIIAVKSYDTENALKSAESLIRNNTFVMSLQNGLDNVEKIQKKVKNDRIYICITTHGVVFSKPGHIKHTGGGRTIMGCLNGKKTVFSTNILNCLNESGIKTSFSKNIEREMWIKAIINSSINPVTSIFSCKNGYLLKNPILEKTIEKICTESTNIANTQGLKLSNSEMIKKTKQVINETSENQSSMLQSIMNNKKTEIDSINEKLIDVGRKHCVDTSLNELLVYCVKKTW